MEKKKRKKESETISLFDIYNGAKMDLYNKKLFRAFQQCDQIGPFLKTLTKKIPCNRSP